MKTIKHCTTVHHISDLINNPHDRQESHFMRRFQSATVTQLDERTMLTTAAADDGTAWCNTGGGWVKLATLPQPTVDPLIDEYAALILTQHAAGHIDTCTAFDHAYELTDDVYQRVHGELKRRTIEQRLVELRAAGNLTRP